MKDLLGGRRILAAGPVGPAGSIGRYSTRPLAVDDLPSVVMVSRIFFRKEMRVGMPRTWAHTSRVSILCGLISTWCDRHGQ